MNPIARDPATPLAPRPDEFYIGWQRSAPGTVARVVRAAAISVVLSGSVTAVLLAAAQSTPDDTVWHSDELVLEGIVRCEPYPVLHATLPGSSTPINILLVAPGKHGAFHAGAYCGPINEMDASGTIENRPAARARKFNGARARCVGTVLESPARTRTAPTDPFSIHAVMELADRTDALTPLSPARVAGTPPVEDLGPLLLSGQIVDPKCFFGAMKPGHGKTHKACAALCIAGGIPPVFIPDDPASSPAAALVVSSDGGPAGDLVHAWVAERIVVSGRLERHGHVTVLRLDPGPEALARPSRVATGIMR